MEAPVLEECAGLVVVRDDYLPGGTKARVLPVLFDEHLEYVYASPVQGYAQVALAHCCRAHRKRATVFCAKRKRWHARTAEAQAAGARIEEVPNGYLNVVQSRARAYAAKVGAKLLPFGLDTPDVLEALAAIARGLAYTPREVWCAAGSGTLTRALQLAWPEARHYAVRVGAEPDAGQARVLQAPELFDADAACPPPFPSCGNYDAKIWQFARKMATPGALIWNVAK